MAYGETLRMRNLPTGPRVRWLVEHTAPNRAERRRFRLPKWKDGTPGRKLLPGRNEPYVARKQASA